jgi:hypothetical protein
MENIKVGIKFRPEEENKDVQWIVGDKTITSKNSKFNFSFGKFQ